MNGYDGPTLRALRENMNVPLRRVARQAGMSHGHLSKVERGEPGRPVTPAVLSAYEKSTGIQLSGVAGHGPADTTSWRRGHMSEAGRKILNAKIAAVAVGGHLGEQVERIMDGTGRARPPELVEEPDIAQLERLAAVCTELDLSLGGAVIDQMAKALLRWAVGMLDAAVADQLQQRLHAAIGALAQRAGWAAFDADSHDVARSLFNIGLYAATKADDPNLRAHLLADFSAQYVYLGFTDDGLHVVRLAEIDERVHPAVLMVIYGVKARAYATRGDTDACWRHIQLTEHAQAQAHAGAQVQPVPPVPTQVQLDQARASVQRPAGIAAPTRDGEAGTAEIPMPPGGTQVNAAVPGWLGTVATRGRLYATTGHALATLARRTGSAEAGEEAQHRLTRAIEALDHTGQTRTVGLCQVQLATLQLETCDDQLGPGLTNAWRALNTVTGVRSSRVNEHLVRLRAAAEAHADNLTAKELVSELDVLLTETAR